MKASAICILLLITCGCADPQARIAAFKAYNDALANCKEQAGCIAATQAAFYTGMLNSRDDSLVSIMAASVPILRIFVDAYGVYHGGGSNGGGNGMYVDGNNNQFIGFNKVTADRGGKVYAPFDATSTPSMSQSWSDMYNSENFRNQNQ